MAGQQELTVELADADETPEYAVFERVEELGWGDGLPIIVPTAQRVAAMLATVDRAPEEVLAVLPPAEVPATIEMIASAGRSAFSCALAM